MLISSCLSVSPLYREELQALQANAAEAADDSMEISTLQLQLDQAEQDRHQLQQVCPPLHALGQFSLGVYLDQAEGIQRQLQQVVQFTLPCKVQKTCLDLALLPKTDSS